MTPMNNIKGAGLAVIGSYLKRSIIRGEHNRYYRKLSPTPGRSRTWVGLRREERQCLLERRRPARGPGRGEGRLVQHCSHRLDVPLLLAALDRRERRPDRFAQRLRCSEEPCRDMGC